MQVLAQDQVLVHQEELGKVSCQLLALWEVLLRLVLELILLLVLALLVARLLAVQVELGLAARRRLFPQAGCYRLVQVLVIVPQPPKPALLLVQVLAQLFPHGALLRVQV